MRTGRPKLSTGEKRSRKVHPALNEAEWQRLEGLAKQAGEHPAITARKLILAGMEKPMKFRTCHSVCGQTEYFDGIEAAETFYGLSLREITDEHGTICAVVRGNQKFCEYLLEDGELFLCED
jgi:hypothetical protein